MPLQQFFNVRALVTLGILPLLAQATIGMSRGAWADEIEQKSTDSIDEILSETVEAESSESIEEIPGLV